ncbi:MAG: hypothetical protein QNK05_20735 [Myxococcota bacterium]|nr:hypothetical protein [Myxococcota bacterium]
MRTAVLLLLASALVGCSATTTIQGTWTPTGPAPEIRSVLVVGLARDEDRRKTFEDTFAASLRGAGLTAVPSYERVPLADVNRNTLVAATQGGALEGVLVVSLLGIESEERTVPGRAYGSAGPAYGTLGDYYGYAYGTYTEPEYVDRYRIVRTETTLYDSLTERLLWKGESESFERSGMARASEDYSRAMARELVVDGKIQRP